MPGLYLVVYPSGKKGWAVRYRHNGKPRKLTLDPYPVLELGAARERARAKAIEEASASRQQDRYYYGQRPAYAYAPPPRPVFGPFSQNQGFFGGRAW